MTTSRDLARLRKLQKRLRRERLEHRKLKRQAQTIGLRLLKEHFESNDPYVDDNPSARYYAEQHRKTCKDCAVYLQLERWKTHNKQMASVLRDLR